MRWSRLGAGLAVIVVSVCALAILGAPISSAPISSNPRETQLTVYTSKASYSLPVLDREGKSYIAVADLLVPLGATSPQLKGKEWRFGIGKNELKLTQNNSKAVIRGHAVDLGGKALVENGRVLAPL